MRYEVKTYIQGFGEDGYWQRRDFYYPVAGESVKIDVGVQVARMKGSLGGKGKISW